MTSHQRPFNNPNSLDNTRSSQLFSFYSQDECLISSPLISHLQAIRMSINLFSSISPTTICMQEKKNLNYLHRNFIKAKSLKCKIWYHSLITNPLSILSLADENSETMKERTHKQAVETGKIDTGQSVSATCRGEERTSVPRELNVCSSAMLMRCGPVVVLVILLVPNPSAFSSCRKSYLHLHLQHWSGCFAFRVDSLYFHCQQQLRDLQLLVEMYPRCNQAVDLLLGHVCRTQCLPMDQSQVVVFPGLAMQQRPFCGGASLG